MQNNRRPSRTEYDALHPRTENISAEEAWVRLYTASDQMLRSYKNILEFYAKWLSNVFDYTHQIKHYKSAREWSALDSLVDMAAQRDLLMYLGAKETLFETAQDCEDDIIVEPTTPAGKRKFAERIVKLVEVMMVENPKRRFPVSAAPFRIHVRGSFTRLAEDTLSFMEDVRTYSNVYKQKTDGGRGLAGTGRVSLRERGRNHAIDALRPFGNGRQNRDLATNAGQRLMGNGQGSRSARVSQPPEQGEAGTEGNANSPLPHPPETAIELADFRLSMDTASEPLHEPSPECETPPRSPSPEYSCETYPPTPLRGSSRATTPNGTPREPRRHFVAWETPRTVIDHLDGGSPDIDDPGLGSLPRVYPRRRRRGDKRAHSESPQRGRYRSESDDEVEQVVLPQLGESSQQPASAQLVDSPLPEDSPQAEDSNEPANSPQPLEGEEGSSSRRVDDPAQKADGLDGNASE